MLNRKRARALAPHTIIPRVRTLILSPHSDDAALSVGGVVLKQELPKPVHLVTVFGRSNYTKWEGFLPPGRESTATREEEERRFASRAEVSLEYMYFKEAPQRLGNSFSKIFRSPVSPDPARPEGLGDYLRLLFRRTRPSFVMLPSGLGAHHDHLLVRDVALEASEPNQFTPVFFEDLPYARECELEVIDRHMSSFGFRLAPVSFVLGEALDDKLDAIVQYRSQIGEEELTAVVEHAERLGDRGGAERLWLTAEGAARLSDSD